MKHIDAVVLLVAALAAGSLAAVGLGSAAGAAAGGSAAPGTTKAPAAKPPAKPTAAKPPAGKKPAAKMAARSPNRELEVVDMWPIACETDGGPVGCSPAVAFLGSAFTYRWSGETPETKILCGEGKEEKLRLKILYEYNEGTFDLIDSDAKKAKWPACVREKLGAAAAPLLKDLWNKIHELDPSIDVRATWELELDIY